MRGRTATATLVAVLTALPGTAGIQELPRSTLFLPVDALVECLDGACAVAEHCAHWLDWIGVEEDDLETDWQLQYRDVRTTQLRANVDQVCAVAVTEGTALFQPYRYKRARDAEGKWVTHAMVYQGWFVLSQTPRAPETAAAFYQLVQDRKMCFDGCGPTADYIHFDAYVYRDGTLGSLPGFTLYTEGEEIGGWWEYASTGLNSADVTLNFYGGVDTCTMALTFDRKTSGSVTMTCQQTGTETGTWEILDR